jgi:hypothetical protein
MVELGSGVRDLFAEGLARDWVRISASKWTRDEGQPQGALAGQLGTPPSHPRGLGHAAPGHFNPTATHRLAFLREVV